MHREQSVDAIITSSDRAAFGVITALHRVGLYVPEDVRLICFDNSPYSSMASPAITALDRQPDLLAEKAARYLLDLMNGKAVPTETLIPVHLCKRDSTR
ncbi:MAG: substrate-binding domain-containing protein, partial [Clostridia bacterium]|nr:substrate-binding domain-containing protein [Clostridia bacterium]